jgi:undecaprenyl-diphosphatase
VQYRGTAVDATVALELHRLATSDSRLATLVVFIANYGIFVLPLALLIYWFRADMPGDRCRDAILVGVVTAGVAFVLGLVLERTLSRPRPFVELGFQPLFPHAADSSFPSDHTLVGVALVGPLLGPARKLGFVLVVWALIVGFARAAAGVHYPSDILGSAVLALGLDGLVGFVIRPIRSQLNLQRWDASLLGNRRRARRQ